MFCFAICVDKFSGCEYETLARGRPEDEAIRRPPPCGRPVSNPGQSHRRPPPYPAELTGSSSPSMLFGVKASTDAILCPAIPIAYTHQIDCHPFLVRLSCTHLHVEFSHYMLCAID
eukprot:scaffold90923_cov24-Prasinocladus_malaysianus.AAC.1